MTPRKGATWCREFQRRERCGQPGGLVSRGSPCGPGLSGREGRFQEAGPVLGFVQACAGGWGCPRFLWGLFTSAGHPGEGGSPFGNPTASGWFEARVLTRMLGGMGLPQQCWWEAAWHAGALPEALCGLLLVLPAAYPERCSSVAA